MSHFPQSGLVCVLQNGLNLNQSYFPKGRGVLCNIYCLLTFQIDYLKITDNPILPSEKKDYKCKVDFFLQFSSDKIYQRRKNLLLLRKRRGNCLKKILWITQFQWSLLCIIQQTIWPCFHVSRNQKCFFRMVGSVTFKTARSNKQWCALKHKLSNTITIFPNSAKGGGGKEKCYFIAIRTQSHLRQPPPQLPTADSTKP